MKATQDVTIDILMDVLDGTIGANLRGETDTTVASSLPIPGGYQVSPMPPRAQAPTPSGSSSVPRSVARWPIA